MAIASMKTFSSAEMAMYKYLLGNSTLSTFIINRLFLNSQKRSNTEMHNARYIFINGLPRSGSTALLEAINAVNDIGSLYYGYLPFILIPQLAHYFYKYFSSKDTKKSERFHLDGLAIGQTTPECLDEIFWKNSQNSLNGFEPKSKNHSILFAQRRISGYYKFLSSYMNLQGSQRMVIKNNSNIQRITLISRAFPSSIFLIPIRDPWSQAASLLRQHNIFLEYHKQDTSIAEFMKLIGHTEFGPFMEIEITEVQNIEPETIYKDPLSINFWLERWKYTYEWLYAYTSELDNVLFVDYHRLCESGSYRDQLAGKLKIPKNSLNGKFKSATTKTGNLSYSKKLYRLCNHVYDEIVSSLD